MEPISVIVLQLLRYKGIILLPGKAVNMSEIHVVLAIIRVAV